MVNDIFSNVHSKIETAAGKIYKLYFNLNVMQRLQLEFGSLTNCFNNLLAPPHNLFAVLRHMLNEGAKVSKAEILKIVSAGVDEILGAISEIATFSIAGSQNRVKKDGANETKFLLPGFSAKQSDTEKWDFVWIYYIAVAKLKLPVFRVGKLTYFEFAKLYEHYKNDFDMELMLKVTNTTYSKLVKKEVANNNSWFLKQPGGVYEK